jgi:tRNA modification GTPase
MIEIEHELIDISAQLFGALDHPNEIPAPDVRPQIKKFLAVLKQFTDNAQTSNYIYNGINVAILGEPNAGKSSLFNSILGHDRSIVTDIAGTTTDLVSETVQINGFKVRFVDTAGIRTATNPIEKLGIERTMTAARECDIAIIFDDTAKKIIGSKPAILVTRNTKVNDIKAQIIKLTVGNPAISNRHIANTRQLNELELCRVALESALAATSPDMTASDIQTALYHIGNITGTNASEAVLDQIFSRFCLGK